ncbi:response regulator [Dinoroseobacter sp. PD6]|uniref:ATP-binding protein n=1 Tax=Dinoroseobacter sp. PD6 TaxID=3028384 RepID=UPI00237B0E18|nr:ATP-binding protein [Dinoroseobacter sp. PD6]MDD9717596.1 response regulator [Dinoroseobacter sp. PD6]
MPEATLKGLDDHAANPFLEFFGKAPVLMHSVDRDGVIVAISAYWAARLGYSPDDMIGRSIMEFMVPESANRARTEVMPTLLRTSSVDKIRHTFLRQDGTPFHALVSAVVLRDADGAFLRTLSIVSADDGTDGLQQDLQAALIRAEDASRAKSRFLAAMSHEIRTPMNAILGFAQLLRLSDLDEKRRGHVDAIIAAGGQLMNLLTDLLDLSHMETGRMRIESRATDLMPLLDQVADWWYSSVSDKGLTLQVEIDDRMPARVLTDPVRLQQVLNNFMANALRYTDRGTITLRVREISRSDSFSRLRLEVEDTGIGISEEQQALLFRPFVQIESDFGKDRGGWGLGLSICHNIAAAMSADIGVTSQPGAGATFHFELTLPLEPCPEPRETPQPHPARAPRGPSAKVLVAEDNPLNQNVMEAMLRDLGHEVRVVSNGFEAVEAILSESFDLVLMDITMPGLDGLGATAQIRTSGPEKSKVPIIACTAHVGGDVQARYRDAGIDGFLPKPVDPRALEAAINSAVSGGAFSHGPGT